MEGKKLTDAQRARIERNRQRALMLRNARLLNRPYPETKLQNAARNCSSDNEVSAMNSVSRVVDTGGGFLLESEDQDTLTKTPKAIVEEPGSLTEQYYTNKHLYIGYFTFILRGV